MLFFVPCLSISENVVSVCMCVCVHSYVHTDANKIITYRRLERNVCGNWEISGLCKRVSDS